jgi:lipoprotein NlpI
LAKNALGLDLNKWPGPVISLYQGTLQVSSVLDAALTTDPRKEREQQCEAYFYIAEQMLIQGQKEEAVRMIQAVLRTGVAHFIEYQSAKTELERMRLADTTK